jgi:transcriptional regulator with XRE-family HTH domain
MRLRIKELRQKRGLTQQQLGEAAGLSKPFVSQLENGRREPSAQTLEALADYLGVKVVDLFEGGGAEGLAGLAEIHGRLSPRGREQLFRIALTLLDDPDQ